METLVDHAKVYAIRGEKDEVYLWLQKAIDGGYRWYDWRVEDPAFENLRDEPRFQKMMAEIKYKVDEMRRRVERLEKEWK
jgi:hypothetical protein